MTKSYKLSPQFRENCIVRGKEEWLSEFSIGDTIFLISNLPTKKYSIISKIESIEISEDPTIIVDMRILGNFGEGDEVFLLKYNPAEALEVHMSISDEFSVISTGDWTSNIKSSLMYKLLDLGKELTFLIPWEGGAPIIGTGIINTTLPSTPVYIGERTRIFLNKLSAEKLTNLKIEKLAEQEARVDILQNQIDQKTIKLIREVKHKNYPNKGQKYHFKDTNPKQLFNSITDIFKGLSIIEEPAEQLFDDQEQNYFASAVFAIKHESDSFQLIDIQVCSSGNTGALIIWVTSENDDIITTTLKNYDSRISQLKQGLEQKAEVLSAQCPECGASLPLENINVNGIVKCTYCNNTSKIPKILRY